MNPTTHATFPEIESWRSDPRLASGRSNKQTVSTLQADERGIPLPVSNVQGMQTSVTLGGAKYTKINLSHTINAADQALHHVNVWVTGYLGNKNPQLLSGSTGNHSLLLPATGDHVTVTLQSVGKDGSLLPLAQSPNKSFTLK